MFRLILGLILAILLFIFIVQNTTLVSLHFLIWSFEGSLALILLLTSIVTLIVGFLVVLPFAIKKRFVKAPKIDKIKPEQNSEHISKS